MARARRSTSTWRSTQLAGELFPALALFEHYKPAERQLAELAPAAAETGLRRVPDRLGDYRIVRYLGEVGMGVVYEAVRESLRSHVALKVMHPSSAAAQPTCAGSARKPARPPGCTTPTS